MAIRFLDSIVAPFLFGLGPYFLIYILSTYPTYKTWLDTYPGAIISAGTCLIILAIGYHSVGDDPIRAATENTRWANRLPSYLLPIITETTTTPPSSIIPSLSHPSIPVPYIGVDVDALEAGEHDLPDRLFRYNAWRYTAIMGVRSCDYLSPGREGLKAKLEKILRLEGITAEDMDKKWLLTRILGLGVNNPFSLWYVYDSQAVLKVVLLERHQGAGQYETYILHPGSSTQSSNAYTHSWTFPSVSSTIPTQSLTLDISDPFSTLRALGGILPLRASLTIRTAMTETSTQTSLSADIEPAKLMIHTMRDVWRLLLESVKKTVLKRLPSLTEIEAFGRAALEVINEPGRWVDRALGGGMDLLRGLRDWIRRGQGGWHTV